MSPFLLLLLLLPLAGATDHIVGGHLGWNPNVSYTPWLKNHTFYVGDLISFRYQKNMYNVWEVNKTGYDNCTLDSAVGNWSSGKDFIPLPEAKRYYFVCGNGFCFSGMKISIVVLPVKEAVANATANRTVGPAVEGSSGSVRITGAVWGVVLGVFGVVGILS